MNSKKVPCCLLLWLQCGERPSHLLLSLLQTLPTRKLFKFQFDTICGHIKKIKFKKISNKREINTLQSHLTSEYDLDKYNKLMINFHC